ncbi:hypothetical protein BN871_HR_00060 [Paenibacillus sp. P22]|nr:hypothetical protein BN871_HR_00060 [Paenibacillus sp. P22]
MTKLTISSFLRSCAINAMLSIALTPSCIDAFVVRLSWLHDMFETIDEAFICHHFLDRMGDARHIAGSVIGIMADLERLSERSEDDLLLGEHAGQPHAVDSEAVVVAAAGALDRLFLARIALLQLAPRLGDKLGRLDGSAGGGVQLLVPMVFDDFKMGKMFGSFRGEFHHQNRPDGEIRRDQPADSLLLAQLVQLGDLLRGKACHAGDGPDSARYGFQSVGVSGLRHGEIDENVDFTAVQHRLQRWRHRHAAWLETDKAARVDSPGRRGHGACQPEAFILQRQLDDLSAHSSGSAGYRDFDRSIHDIDPLELNSRIAPYRSARLVRRLDRPVQLAQKNAGFLRGRIQPACFHYAIFCILEPIEHVIALSRREAGLGVERIQQPGLLGE